MRVYEQLREGEGELRAVEAENRQLKVQRERNEQGLRQVEKEAERVQREERQAREHWDSKVREIEKRVQDRRVESLKVVEQLGAVNCEIAQLRVQA